MRSLLALIAVVSLSSCSLVGPDIGPPNAEATLVNETGVSIYAFAVDVETSTLIDIAGTIQITDQTRDRVVAPGEDAEMDVEAYDPGDGVVVYVYRVEEDTAEFADMLQIGGSTFERAGGVVRVRQLSPPWHGGRD